MAHLVPSVVFRLYGAQELTRNPPRFGEESRCFGYDSFLGPRDCGMFDTDEAVDAAAAIAATAAATVAATTATGTQSHTIEASMCVDGPRDLDDDWVLIR